MTESDVCPFRQATPPVTRGLRSLTADPSSRCEVPGAAAAFAEEQGRLLALGRAHLLALEHIGSTAVPGMHAKPILDLLGGVATLVDADALVERLCTAGGYTTSRTFNETLSDRRWLMRHANGRRTHHLHLVVFEGPIWLKHLAFRDRRRADAALAARYSALEQQLAQRTQTIVRRTRTPSPASSMRSSSAREPRDTTAGRCAVGRLARNPHQPPGTLRKAS